MTIFCNSEFKICAKNRFLRVGGRGSGVGGSGRTPHFNWSIYRGGNFFFFFFLNPD